MRPCPTTSILPRVRYHRSEIRASPLPLGKQEVGRNRVRAARCAGSLFCSQPRIFTAGFGWHPAFASTILALRSNLWRGTSETFGGLELPPPYGLAAPKHGPVDSRLHTSSARGRLLARVRFGQFHRGPRGPATGLTGNGPTRTTVRAQEISEGASQPPQASLRKAAPSRKSTHRNDSWGSTGALRSEPARRPRNETKRSRKFPGGRRPGHMRGRGRARVGRIPSSVGSRRR